MGTRSYALSDDQRKYFSDVDNSIVHHSVELGKLTLQLEALKGALGDLYGSRMKALNAMVAEAGIDPSSFLGARVEGEHLVVHLRDEPASAP